MKFKLLIINKSLYRILKNIFRYYIFYKYKYTISFSIIIKFNKLNNQTFNFKYQNI